ncbi:MAG TPA: hypothetical protein VHH73_19980 [Verrucomicrobiae bacterium]|nr:hypothetical protein [Verrucomicrobiae bacterium]
MLRLSHDLLGQARFLASQDQRRPKEANLRRAISAAYYALFHYLIEETTSLTIGTANNLDNLRQFAGRSFAHRKMKEACREFNKPVPKQILAPFWASLGVPNNADVKTIATNFIGLQEQRHAADYDLSQRFTRNDAGAAVIRAREAMNAWTRLKISHQELATLFALSLMLWSGLGDRQ